MFGTGSEAKRALVESLDATLIPYGDGVADRVRELLPDGVDAIFDLVGGDSLRSVAGLLSRRASWSPPPTRMTAAEFGGAPSPGTGPRGCWTSSPGWWPTASWTRTSRRAALADAAQAIASVESGHALGKVVIEIS